MIGSSRMTLGRAALAHVMVEDPSMRRGGSPPVEDLCMRGAAVPTHSAPKCSFPQGNTFPQ
eukprot:4791264-Amphidinium_carterae.1